jgi:site-specific DNA-methyltransferase (adenine-specific)
MNSPRAGAGRTSGAKNFHPTVKPTSLMEYLIKLVTPPQGTVLDPFTGSGSTGKAAILQGFDFIGIEMTEEYLPIIEGRLKHAEAKVAERIKETADQEQEKLF